MWRPGGRRDRRFVERRGVVPSDEQRRGRSSAFRVVGWGRSQTTNAAVDMMSRGPPEAPQY